MNIRKVLLVDDEPDIRTVGQLALSRVGKWETILASTGAEALEKARTEQPDAILLDVMMPGMDGPTTLKGILADETTRQIPVIFVTAKVRKDEVAEYRTMGAIGVVAKPFDPMTLPDQIRTILADR